jgi:branched-chain amino acid transport system substrate-binding protein
MISIIARLLPVLFALLVFGPFTRATCAEQLPLTIGVLSDLTGPYSALDGEGSVTAARIAVADFGGQVLGRRVSILAGDHHNKPAVALAVAEDWFNPARDGSPVSMITGLTNSAVALAIQKRATERGKISITVGAGSTDLTGKACTEMGFQWAFDTYSNTAPLGRAMVGFGLNTWFFITADYAFGWSMEQEATRGIKAAGGTVVGSRRHPLGTQDFSTYLAAGQDSNAKVIALANAGTDTINAVRQAAEIGISPRSQTLAPLLVFITDVHTIGLDLAKGMTFVTGFYWDRDDTSRALSERFLTAHGAMPTMVQAGVYSAVMHYLRAVQAAGTDEAKAVAARMRAVPVNDSFATNGLVRADGRMSHDMYLVQVKGSEESQHPWDYYKILKTIPGDEAFRPLSESECPLVANQK